MGHIVIGDTVSAGTSPGLIGGGESLDARRMRALSLNAWSDIWCGGATGSVSSHRLPGGRICCGGVPARERCASE